MGSSEKNPSGSSQLKGFMDLLMDLQILNPSQKGKTESLSHKEEVIDQSEASSSQSVQKRQDAQINTLPVVEAESKESGEEGEFHLQDAELEPYAESGREGSVEKSVEQTDKAFTPELAFPFLTERLQQIGHDANGNFYEERSANDTPPDFVPPTVHPETTSHSAITPLSSAVSDFPSTVEDGQNGLSQSQPLKKQPHESKNESLLFQVVEALQDKLSQSQPPEKQPHESKNQPVPSPEDLSQPEHSHTSPEQAVNRLIQSHWQKTQQSEYKNYLNGSTNHQDVENSIALFERWQRLLLTQEVMDSRQAIAEFKKKLDSLEHQIYEPTELINLLLPLIAEILSLKVTQAREDVARAIAPVVDDMIQRRAQQDIVAISTALAPVIPEAVAKQVLNSPGALAKALGPEMSTAIKEQINLERDAMVDALYPVIGSTISKYMAEAIRAINEKVENAFSLEGLSRKVRARLQGISEAELILQESIPFTIQAVFLIHKGSGLVIAEVQPSDQQHLESEMVAGMLTAIRSFVNDVIAQSGEVSEIDEIDYGGSKIILEVAGYCYLASVTKGEPPKSFRRKMHSTLSSIIQKYSKPIELFDGDPTNVPEEVHQLLDRLTTRPDTELAGKKSKAPVGLILIGLGALTAISIPVGMYKHLSGIDHRREEEISLALSSDPELAVYRLGVDANGGTIKLSGKLPNQYLRSKAEQVAHKVEPELKIQNAIIPVELPPDPVLAAAEVKRVTNVMNQLQGAVIQADYSEGVVTVKGAVLQEDDAKKITQAFLQIPGVKSVANTVQLQPLAIASRVYFDQGSSEIKSEERTKIAQIRAFLDQHPNKHLKLLGHTDPKGTAAENQALALERAKKVKDVLVAQGVDSKRLHVEGTIDAPIGVSAQQLPLLSRCVEFEIISP